MKKQRIYLDTSVFGGYLDSEFDAFTKPLFDRIQKGEFTILLSAVLQKELKPAPEKIANLIKKLDNKHTEFLEENDQVLHLAIEYITEKMVGKTSYADCLYIALATINRADLPVSWPRNFRVSTHACQQVSHKYRADTWLQFHKY